MASDTDGADDVAAAASGRTGETAFLKRLGIAAVWGILAILWHDILRTGVVWAFSIPWILMQGPFAAGLWRLVVQPLAAAVAAFLTLQTNIRNEVFHRALVVVVLASAILPAGVPLLGQASVATANPYVAQAVDLARVASYAIQALAVIGSSGLSLLVVKRRRARIIPGS
jgi:hypothetical protein